MKVLLPVGFVGCLALAFLCIPPGAAPAQAPEATPPPLNPASTALPGNVIVAPGPVVPPAIDATRPAPEPTVRARPDGPKFMGAMTCSSSLCHGGGSNARDAYTIWNKSDPHHQAAATLAGTRAARIAQGLALASAAGSSRCTVCHTPLADVATTRLPTGFDARTEGVSCETCHGPAQNWIRSHTRLDFTHAQNVQTGVREVRSLYARANTCVACHQVLAADLLTAGHPPLLFELDAQTVAEPRHWIDAGDYFGPQAWLTGQAVALREMSWALSQDVDTVPAAREQWRALLWLLQRTEQARGDSGEGHTLPTFDTVPAAEEFTPGNLAHAQATADEVARSAARLEWTRTSTRRCLDRLADSEKEFTTASGPEEELALRSRAQRLCLALSRLMAPLQKQAPAAWAAASHELDQLFAAADAQAIFRGTAFGEQLRRLNAEIAKVPEG